MSTLRYDFSGKTVVVTGAARGIGLGIATAFLSAGAQVIAVDLSFDRPERQGEEQIQCDLSDMALLEQTFAGIAAQHPDIHALVNNAGSDKRIPFGDMTAQEWRWMLDVNLTHFARITQLLLPALRQGKGGAVVNMSSSAWMKLAGNLTAYHAAKAGIVGLTRGLARDLGGDFIRVNAIAPGRVFTERSQGSVTDDYIAETHRLQCLPQLIAAEDIAQTALWLASEGAQMLTGQVIVVDGGVV
ncbi:SDR family NAD(P)-dependent oxidoreductase [Cognatishimia sp. SS12]|uniref:SDR family NAD(P)-dependent oxidoreductase n=1 Tax=Cognatishimia sp. SS12 TaxID=2979465 RepID=UPI002330D2A2|nr:SDR family NAD(P)-dependent oxidoreductase [Cognatishimia sp. SS12]MDC0738308.1 SDR family NAD(P)-dependent oxidoreductase [Cognatishimia sp. SS12]